jgi:tetratricopeptide (TPR) repeat protein
MALAQQMNDPWALGYVWGTIGDVARVRGDDDQALAAYREFVRWNQIAGTRMWQGISNYYLSTVQLRLGALDDAELSLRAALATFRQFGTLYLYGLALTGLAESAAQRGQAARAVRLFARLDRLYRDLGILRQPIERAESERDFAVARSQLDPAAFASAWAEGETMSIENAIDYALGTG